MAGGNENASEDMGALVINGDRIRQATKAHVSWIHHSGKDTARGARGHSLLRAATDTEIEITKAEDGSRLARVTKQREMEIDPDGMAYTLHVVELGTNRRGKSVTSCVVQVLETVPGQVGTGGTSRHVPTVAQIGVRALNNALGRCGAILPPLNDYPSNTSAVTHSEWRAEFYQLQGDAKPDSKKKSFQRAEQWLITHTKVTIRNGYVWFVSRDMEAGQ